MIQLNNLLSVMRCLNELRKIKELLPSRFRPHISSSVLLNGFPLNLVLPVYANNCRFAFNFGPYRRRI